MPGSIELIFVEICQILEYDENKNRRYILWNLVRKRDCFYITSTKY